jgi:transposase
MGRERRSFTLEYKQEAVRLLLESKRPVREIARQLGVRPDLLRRWKQNVEANGRLAKPPVKDYEEAYRRLQRENAVLRQEREFLKKAAAFFAKGSDAGSP